MLYEKDGCKFIDVNIEFIEEYLSNNSSILLKPYINGKISYIKYDNDGHPKYGFIKSKEIVPFEHDFCIDIEKNNYDPIFMEMFTRGKTPVESDNCFLFGKFSNITDKENIAKIFFSGERVLSFLPEFVDEFYYYCGLQIKKENNKYFSSLIKKYFTYEIDDYHDITYLTGDGNDLKSSLDSLEQQINIYSSDKIINLLAKKYNETDLRFNFEEQKKVLSLTRKHR